MAVSFAASASAPTPSSAVAPASRRDALLDVAALLAALGAVLVLLELRHPYFFLEDDNRTSQLGLLVHYLRGLRHGELPLYNFHQFLGMPSFAVGSVPLLYPPVYLAVLASQSLFGHPDAAIDLLVAAHLAAGLWGMHRLLRGLALTRGAAALGAISWPLSSMAVYTASSWWNVGGVIAYLPWTILLALRLLRGFQTRTFVALVLVRASFLYLGHIQLWVYALCFEVLCVGLAALADERSLDAPSPALAATRREARARHLLRALSPYLASLYATAALALPFAQPLWQQASGSTERGSALVYRAFSGGSFNVVSWLVGTVDPYRADPDYFGMPLGFVFERAFPYLSFIGHAALVLLVLAPFVLGRARGWRIPPVAFGAPFLVAFLWTVGALDRALFLVPVFNRFRWHFRVEVFVVFFALVLAAMTLTALERSAREGRRARAVAALALGIQLAGFAVLYGACPPRPFNHRPIRERPPLADPLVTRLGHGRIVSLGNHSADPYSSAELGFDYASLWGLFHYAGYGNVLSARHAAVVTGMDDPEHRRPRHDGVFKPQTIPFDRFERWAVRWYVLGKNDEDPGETARYRSQLEARGLRLVAEDARRRVYEDSAADPLLALEGAGRREDLSPEVGGRSLTVRFAPAFSTRRLVAAFLAVPGLTARAGDGRALPFAADGWGRGVVTVPAGVRSVRLVYREAALAAGARNAALLLAPLAFVAWWRGRARRRATRAGALESAAS